MSTSSSRRKLTRGVAALATAASLGSLIVTSVSSAPPASADPQAFLVGVGSDTTQDIMNAMAGTNNGIQYLPIQSSVASNLKQLSSYDAIVGTTKGTCITTRPGSTFDRPNGSTNGRRALSRAIDNNPFKVTGPGGTPASTCPAPAPTTGNLIGGLVDFARSSSTPSGAAGSLMHIPFAKDALGFAYATPSAGLGGGLVPQTSLTSAELTSIFSNPTPTTTPFIKNGVEIVPCSIQTSSGTYGVFNTDIGVTPAQMATASAPCTPVGSELEENDGNLLKAKAESFGAGKQVIIGFSVSSFIAQSNGAAKSRLADPVTGPSGVQIGSIGPLVPYVGTAPTLAPCFAPTGGSVPSGCGPDYYASSFGRLVYNVVPASKITGPGNADFKSMFANVGGVVPSMCSNAAPTLAQDRLIKFGFATLSSAPGVGNCGDTSVTTGPVNTDGLF